VTFHPLFAAFASDGTLQPGEVNVNSSLAQSQDANASKIGYQDENPDNGNYHWLKFVLIGKNLKDTLLKFTWSWNALARSPARTPRVECNSCLGRKQGHYYSENASRWRDYRDNFLPSGSHP
jgi:hypothetical protein